MEISQLEYRAARDEVIMRAKLLHQLIALSSFLSLVGIFVLGRAWVEQEYLVFDRLLLALPLIFAGILFNYQANQMTLEAVAAYSDRLVSSGNANRPTWDQVYGHRKRLVQLISFMKVVPLLLPLFLPVGYLWRNGGLPDNSLDITLFVLDVAFLLIGLFNFRYKRF